MNRSLSKQLLRSWPVTWPPKLSKPSCESHSYSGTRMETAWSRDKSSLTVSGNCTRLRSKKQLMKKLFPSLKRPIQMVVVLSTSLSGAPRLLTRTSCSTRATCELLSRSSTRTVEALLRLPRSPPSSAKTSTLTTPSGEKWSVKSIQMVTEWSTLMNSRPWCLGLLIADQIGHKKKQKGSD